MKKNHILIVIVIFLLGLLLWELWPEKVETVYLDFQKNLGEQIYELNCQVINTLLDRKWEIRYPDIISKNETKMVSAILLDPSSTEVSTSSDENECDIAVEVYLDVPGIETVPGQRLIEPFQIEAPLRYEWAIQKREGDLSGTIWIYLLLSDKNEGKISRYPLFALPIEFRTISFFGISPRIWRVILFLLSMITVGIYYLFKSIDRE